MTYMGYVGNFVLQSLRTIFHPYRSQDTRFKALSCCLAANLDPPDTLDWVSDAVVTHPPRWSGWPNSTSVSLLCRICRGLHCAHSSPCPYWNTHINVVRGCDFGIHSCAKLQRDVILYEVTGYWVIICRFAEKFIFKHLIRSNYYYKQLEARYRKCHVMRKFRSWSVTGDRELSSIAQQARASKKR